MTDTEYEAVLNEVHEPIMVCGIEFDAGYALRKLDPVAFRMFKLEAEDIMAEEFPAE